jgi:hypothetical protein
VKRGFVEFFLVDQHVSVAGTAVELCETPVLATTKALLLDVFRAK